MERLPSRFEARFYFVVRQAPSIHHVCVFRNPAREMQLLSGDLPVPGFKGGFFANSGVQIK